MEGVGGDGRGSPWGVDGCRDKAKDERRGALQCVTDDETVRDSGRDDVCFGLGGREQATTTATATAATLGGMIRTIRATQYVTALREGGSLPAIIEADDCGLYVLKFRGAGQRALGR